MNMTQTQTHTRTHTKDNHQQELLRSYTNTNSLMALRGTCNTFYYKLFFLYMFFSHTPLLDFPFFFFCHQLLNNKLTAPVSGQHPANTLMTHQPAFWSRLLSTPLTVGALKMLKHQKMLGNSWLGCSKHVSMENQIDK